MAWVGAAALVLGLAALGATHFASADTTDGVVGGNIMLPWSMPDAPEVGLTNLTFPITVNAATERVEGVYFAQQYEFTNVPVSSSSNPTFPSVGYTGLQPRADVNGRQRLHAAFSSFVSGTTSNDPNCSDGADGGPGVSCASDFDGVYGHQYAITVEQTGADTWSGVARDTVTGVESHIGTYTLPSGSGRLKNSEVAFVEYYLTVASCDKAWPVDVVFGAPSTTDAGSLTGSVQPGEEYSSGNCRGRYTATAEGGGTHVTRNVGAASGTAAPSAPPATPCSRNPVGRPCSDPVPAASSPSSAPGATQLRPATPRMSKPSFRKFRRR